MKKRTDDTVRCTYNVREAACVAGVGERSIRVGVAKGEIPHIRLSRSILIPRNAFHRWLDSCGHSEGISKP